METGARETPITTAGGTFTIDPTLNQQEWVYTGSGTLSSSITIALDSSNIVAGVTYHFQVRYNCTFTLNGSSITILSTTLSQEQSVGGNTIFNCTYINGALKVAVLDSDTIQPKAVDGIATTNLDGSGGTVTLVPNADYQTQVLTGTNPLTGSYVYTATGTQNGQKFRIIYNGTMSPTGGNITLFGYQLSDEQCLYGNVTVDAEYNGGSWDISVSQDPNTFTSGFSDEFIVPVSFESGEQCNNTFYAWFDGEILSLQAAVTKALAGTDAGTVQLYIGGNPVASGLITVPLSSALDDLVIVPTVTGATFSAGDPIYLTTSKATAGGKLLVTAQVLRA